jgi:alpha-tubulin suppressor-like RCC1 family protein
MAVAVGDAYTLFVNADGKLFACGRNDFGQLGVGDWASKMFATVVDPYELTQLHEQDVIMVSAGDTHAGCVTSSGAVWMWGNAQSGALGLPDHHIHAQWLPRAMYTPDMAVGRPAAVMVACGCSFTLVLDACGAVWSCGSGHCGQLGQGDDVDTYVLKKMNANSFAGMPIGMIAVGGWHSMAVERDTGVLWTWGCNENGKLGQDHRRDNISLPASIDPATFHDTVAKAAAVIADAAGEKHSYLDDVVVSVAGGSHHTMVVTVAGVLWGCGSSVQGQRGTGNNNVASVFERVGGQDYFGEGGVRMVSCHQNHTQIVAHDNTVWACGAGNSSTLGIPTEERHGDMLIPWRLSVAYFGYDDVTVVASGSCHAAAMTATGQLYTWGCGHMSGDTPGPSGLGYDNSGGIQWVPRLVALNIPGDPRLGRWHGLHPRFALAFVMAQHAHLGQYSASHTFPVGPLQQMLQNIFFVPRAGTSRGILNLMGLIAQRFQ